MNFKLKRDPTPLTHPSREWHTWFAWFPVIVTETINYYHSRGRLVWLENVERKFWEDYGYGLWGYNYRQLGK